MAPTIPLLILAIPLTMFLVLGLLGPKMSHKFAGWLGVCGMGTTLVLAYYTAFTYFFSGSTDFIAGADKSRPSAVHRVQSGLASVLR